MEVNKNTWYDVLGYEGHYQVNGKGEVKSLNYHCSRKEKLLKPANSNNYMIVALTKNKKRKTCLVHRLVYEAINGKIPTGYEIDHINGIKNDNRIENLRCVTPKENKNNPNTKPKHDAANRANSKKFCKRVLELDINNGNIIKTFNSTREVSDYYGINRTCIKKCCSFQQNHADGKIFTYENNKTKEDLLIELARRKANMSKKIKPSKQAYEASVEKCSKPVAQIDKKTGELIAIFKSGAEASRKTGVGVDTISKLCTGKQKETKTAFTWRFVTTENGIDNII